MPRPTTMIGWGSGPEEVPPRCFQQGAGVGSPEGMPAKCFEQAAVESRIGLAVENQDVVEGLEHDQAPIVDREGVERGQGNHLSEGDQSDGDVVLACAAMVAARPILHRRACSVMRKTNRFDASKRI